MQANYAAGKAAIVGLTKTVAKEWGHLNVRCNAIAYGWIDTRLTRSKEGGEAILVGGEKVGRGLDSAVTTVLQFLVAAVHLSRAGSTGCAPRKLIALSVLPSGWPCGSTIFWGGCASHVCNDHSDIAHQ